MAEQIDRADLEAFCLKLSSWGQGIHAAIDYDVATNPHLFTDDESGEEYFDGLYAGDVELANKIEQARVLLSEIKNTFYGGDDDPTC